MSEVRSVIHYMTVDPDLRSGRQRIFCKRLHSLELLSDLRSRCPGCPYFMGTEQGDVVICRWDDVSKYSERVIPLGRNREFYRLVSEYIDEGVLKKG